jgi:hypothetical protein
LLGRVPSTISRKLRRAASVIGQAENPSVLGHIAHQLGFVAQIKVKS